ncbi:MAG TPA: hypothetical protein VGL56_06160, partial [Fimbriimonadaceae bacterium]
MSDWTAQAPKGISFDDENALINTLRRLARAAGLKVVQSRSLDQETRSSADLALERNGELLLFAKRRKLDNTKARVDVDRRPKPRHILLEKNGHYGVFCGLRLSLPRKKRMATLNPWKVLKPLAANFTSWIKAFVPSA